MKKYSLVIVDLQHDFYNPKGSLYVKNAENLPYLINTFIRKHKDEIYQVIFTLDWHTPYNESFKHMGGPWPTHCVQYTEGAGIPSWLIENIRVLDIHIEYSKKGFMNDDEYGAFATNYTINRNDDEDDRLKFILNANYPDKENEIETYSDNYVVCGLCGDFCVLETIKNLRKNPNFTVKAATDLIMSIDGGKKFNEYCKDTNLELV